MTPDPHVREAASDDAELLVVVLHPRDAEVATAAGADRVLLASRTGATFGGVDDAAVAAVCRATDLPVWPLLDPATPGAATHAVDLGAQGLVFGFLDRDLRVDRVACAEVVAATGVPWAFRGIDTALDADRAWRDLADLPGLEAVITAGSTRGLARGAEDLIARCAADPRAAALTMAGGGLSADQVPWLVRAGVRRFAVGSSARAGQSWTRGSVAAEQVRTWRNLIDDALHRAQGLPPG